MERRWVYWAGWPSRAVSVLVCLMMVASSEDKQKDDDIHVVPMLTVHSAHLDAALHHYHTLHVDQISHTPSADRLTHTVSLATLDRHFHIVLEQDRSILAKDFAVYSVDSEGRRHLYDIDTRTFLHGHLKGEEGSTLVTAHLPDSGVLTAIIATPTDTYHIEPSHRYIKEPHPFHMVAYAKSHVKDRLNSTRFDYNVPPVHLHDQHSSWSKQHTHSDTASPLPSRRLRRQSAGNIRGNTCNMILVADFSAFTMFRGLESTASQLVLLLSSIDKQIYRPTEWSVDLDDNIVSGLGHNVQRVLIHTEPSQDRMNYNRDDTDSRAGDILGLMRFGPWSPYCLAHLFTNRNFPTGLLGLANIASPVDGQTGGICSREFQDFSFEPPQSLIYNTGISTYNNDGLPMILSEMVRVVGHELGHNWGSHHDPSLQQCDNFLMNEYAQDGSEGSHMRFSICSRRSIGEVLVNKASCFMEPEPVCGDFQVAAEGEQCDAGENGDQCCTRECTLTQGSTCSDVNSLCCENCSVANAARICRTGPRLSTDCTADTFCNGVDIVCPDTPEPATNGTECRNGICLLTTEDPDNLTECVPLCVTLGNYTLCTCGGDDECMVCCEGPGRACSPVSEKPLADGSPCQSGVCRAGECSPLTQDQIARIWTIIVTLNGSALLQFINENIVGFTLIFSIPVWCIGSCLLYWLVDYPKKKQFEEAIDKAGIGVFIRRNKKPSASGKKPFERKPLLDESEDFSVDEPEDNLPPPDYKHI